MFLQQLPDVIRWLLLFAVGVSAGALINLAIYQLALFKKRNISPWSPAAEGQSRSWFDRIPVAGWLLLRRERETHGRGFWIRPLLIELLTGIGLVWFYRWQTAGGLVGGLDHLTDAMLQVMPSATFGWFLFHSVLFALLTIATFIDFDEQTIPDWVTIPGTLFALAALTLVPALRLPVTNPDGLKTTITPLAFWSPGNTGEWHLGTWGPGIGILIVLVWCFALIPKWCTLRFGLVRGWRIMWASILRPRRKTTGTVDRVQPRQMLPSTRILLGLAVLLSLFVIAVYLMREATPVRGAAWDAVFSALLGLAMGGGIVWAVRIVAGKALGVEAMGFGDVTLMCMVGAFLGWQPALLTFVLAPFASIVVALAQLFRSGENRLAFGPYLCIAAVVVVLGWFWIWNKWAAIGVFALGGQFLLIVLLVCLVLMAIMLGIWGKFKYR